MCIVISIFQMTSKGRLREPRGPAHGHTFTKRVSITYIDTWHPEPSQAALGLAENEVCAQVPPLPFPGFMTLGKALLLPGLSFPAMAGKRSCLSQRTQKCVQTLYPQ